MVLKAGWESRPRRGRRWWSGAGRICGNDAGATMGVMAGLIWRRTAEAGAGGGLV
ncbi:MAG: hypothetical protein KF770_28840 [Anaerolineae bacterium]|nr:hypothetical protein [Anaerolineae bacterium]